MHEAAQTRRLLIVDPSDDCHQLIPVLQAAGWAVDSNTLEAALNQRCDVGLIRLMPEHFEHPEAVKELITRSNTQWIAVLAPNDLRREKIGDFAGIGRLLFHTQRQGLDAFQ